MKLVQVRHASSKTGKGDMHILHQNVGRLSLLFSYDAQFGYNKSVNEGTVKFFREIWGNFSISPKIGIWGDESNHKIIKLKLTKIKTKIIPYPQLIIMYPEAVHSLVLRSKD